MEEVTQLNAILLLLKSAITFGQPKIFFKIYLVCHNTGLVNTRTLILFCKMFCVLMPKSK